MIKSLAGAPSQFLQAPKPPGQGTLCTWLAQLAEPGTQVTGTCLGLRVGQPESQFPAPSSAFDFELVAAIKSVCVSEDRREGRNLPQRLGHSRQAVLTPPPYFFNGFL